MLLLNVHKVNNDGPGVKKGIYIEVLNVDKVYRSAVVQENEVEFFCKEVVIAMLAAASAGTPAIQTAIPEPVEIKKTFKNGIGLTDDHHKAIFLKDGKEHSFEEGARWMVADALKVRVIKAIDSGGHLKGEW
jgi:hypothetical protein